MKVLRDAASTGVEVGFGILTAGYFSGPRAAVAVGASSTYLYPFIYLLISRSNYIGNSLTLTFFSSGFENSLNLYKEALFIDE
jgi:hypothetical protein